MLLAEYTKFDGVVMSLPPNAARLAMICPLSGSRAVVRGDPDRIDWITGGLPPVLMATASEREAGHLPAFAYPFSIVTRIPA